MHQATYTEFTALKYQGKKCALYEDYYTKLTSLVRLATPLHSMAYSLGTQYWR